MQEFLNKLENPKNEYRPIPFWSWNDKLEQEILKWQIKEMDKAGLGGYFMHARGGLQTKYLSGEWMECIRVCIEEGSKYGMGSWCYDEEGWPSGFAGGLVTALGEQTHMGWLEIEELLDPDVLAENIVLGIYRIENENRKLCRIKHQEYYKYALINEKLILIKEKRNPYYIDILNKDVVKYFIETTHEKYYELFNEKFGRGMLGFFTDEPQYAKGVVPWSQVLPQEFYKKYGYDLLDMLPALFLECIGYEKFRYDYWSLVNELYVKSFGEQIHHWCEEHSCMLTGHSVQEDNLLGQMQCSAGVMSFYEYMHIPGIDWLGRKIGSPVVPKQAASIANQLEKKFVLTETFALCGWNVSFEELKWIAEWQLVNGVNLVCQHLEGYSLRGLRKRDYPPSLFYQQSWWKEYKLFNDYFTRLGVLLTSGKSAANVLVIHPIKSAWIEYNCGSNGNLDKIDKHFEEVSKDLSDLHVDYHFGDETIIGKYGSVKDNKFVVGNCEYDTVVLPSMISIDEHTARLLNKFIDHGGIVISTGDFPRLCDGDENKETGLIDTLKERSIHTAADGRNLHEFLNNFSIRQISIVGNNGEIGSIHYQQRDLGNLQIFYMVNHSKNETLDALVTIKGRGRVREYRAENNEISDIDFDHEEDCTKFRVVFLPMQSHIVFFEKGVNERYFKATIHKKVIVPDQEWTLEDTDLNSLTLDYCSYQINDNTWEGPVYTIKLMDILLKERQECDISLKFTFEVDMDLRTKKELFLVAEMANEFKIFVNGLKVDYSDWGWWKDISFKKVDIRKFVKPGMNDIILKRRFFQSQKVYDILFGDNILETEKNKLTFDVELESIYVVGNFGVSSKSGYSHGDRKTILSDGPFVVVDKPEKVKRGDLTKQGFCFFAGSLKMCQDINIVKENDERILLDFGMINSAVSKVYLNDRLVKNLPWAPYIVDVTDFVINGWNKLTLALFSGNRNLLGPHHHASGELYSVCPSSFTDQPGWGEEDTEDQWRDSYCFVRFGIEK